MIIDAYKHGGLSLISKIGYDNDGILGGGAMVIVGFYYLIFLASAAGPRNS